jgi:hypothetical protein
MSESITLDPNDPFDAALIPIVLMNRKKRADYALDGDPFSNFRTTAETLGLAGFGAKEAVLFNVLQKTDRLRSLRASGRIDDHDNATVIDTYLDLAVYSIILYALSLQEKKIDFPNFNFRVDQKIARCSKGHVVYLPIDPEEKMFPCGCPVRGAKEPPK